MQITQRLAITLLLFGAALLAAHFIDRNSMPSSQTKAEEAPKITPVPGPPGVQLGPSYSLPIVSDRAALTQYGRMARLMAEARDLRVFAETAKQRPSEGGIAYADAAIAYCISLRGVKERMASVERQAANDAAFGARRMKFISDLLRRCDSFTAEELGGTSVEALFKSGLSTDPIIQARAKLHVWSRLTKQEREATAQAVLDMKDPILLQRLGSFYQVSEGDSQVVYFNGKAFGGVDPIAFQMALNLLPCAFGQPCDSSDAEVVNACAIDGLCFNDLWQLRQFASRDKPELFNSALDVYLQLVQAVSAGDPAAFRPPSKGAAAERPRVQPVSHGSSVPPVKGAFR
jgi:hypothetical protein